MALPDLIRSTGSVNFGPGHNPDHKSSGGNYYAVILSGTTAAYYGVYKQATPGSGPWTLTDDGSEPTSRGLCVSSDSDGTYIHITTLTPALLLLYHRFNMSTDTWSVVDQTIADLSGMVAPSATTAWCSIEYLSSATAGREIKVSASGIPDADMGKNYEKGDLWYSASGGGTWSGPFSIDAAAIAQHEIQPQLVRATDNSRVHVFWGGDYTSPGDPPSALDVVLARTFDDSATPAGSTIRSASQAAGNLLGLSNPVCYDNSGTGQIFCAQNADSANVLGYRATEDASNDIGALTAETLTTTDPFANGEVGILGLAVSGTDIYCLFSGGGASGADKDLYIISSTDHGDTWSGETEIEDAITCNYISAAVLDTGKIAYLYDNGGVTYYNEYTLAGGPTEVSVSFGVTANQTPSGGALAEAALQGNVAGSAVFFADALAASQLIESIILDSSFSATLVFEESLNFAVDLTALLSGDAAALAALNPVINASYSASGQADTSGSITESTTNDAIPAGQSDAASQISGDVSVSDLEVGTASAEGSIAGNQSLGDESSGDATGNASQSYAVIVGDNISALAQVEANISPIVQLDMTLIASVISGGAIEAAITVANQVSVIAVADALASAILAFSTSLASTFSGDASAGAAHNASATLDQTNTGAASALAGHSADVSAEGTPSGDASASSSLTMPVQVSDAVIAAAIAEVNQSFGILLDYSVVGEVVASGAVEVSVSFAQQFNVTATAIAQANATFVISSAVASNVIAEAAALAGLSIGNVLDVAVSGDLVTGVITTPDGRVYTVSARLRIQKISRLRTEDSSRSRTTHH